MTLNDIIEDVELQGMKQPLDRILDFIVTQDDLTEIKNELCERVIGKSEKVIDNIRKKNIRDAESITFSVSGNKVTVSYYWEVTPKEMAGLIKSSIKRRSKGGEQTFEEWQEYLENLVND